MSLRLPPARAARALSLLRTVQYTHPPSCPCHSNPGHHHINSPPSSILNIAKRSPSTPQDAASQKEYAFEMAASSIRFGPGCTKEVGMDFRNMGAKRVLVVTDKTVRGLEAMRQAVQGLEGEGVGFEVFDGVRVEPKDSS
jgi:hydroxyacid-oxoacid transhydrogenase